MSWKTRGKRGDVLENLIEFTNDHYLRLGIARVDKAATPITVVDIDEQGFITKAYFEKKSTVDYYGIAQGIALSFDAKETRLKSFPLKNIHEHQVEYMKDVTKHGGFAFLIIYFHFYDKYMLLPFEILQGCYSKFKQGGKASIPLCEIPEEFEIKRESSIIPYLDALNVYIDYRNKKLFKF